MRKPKRPSEATVAFREYLCVDVKIEGLCALESTHPAVVRTEPGQPTEEGETQP